MPLMAQAGLKKIRHDFQHAVTSLMAGTVIDPLEMIEIDQHQYMRRPLRVPRLTQQPVCPLHEGTPVIDAGQRVTQRL
jgi:hypothetical protein